jgi:WD40 repeat protein
VATNLEGECSIISLQDNMNIIKHEMIEGHMKSNIAYCCYTMKTPESQKGTFLIGSENKLITKFEFDHRDNDIEKVGHFAGHSNSVRNLQMAPSGKYLLSTCEDHSMRLWDYQTFDPLLIFSGHHDNVVRFNTPIKCLLYSLELPSLTKAQL